MYTNEIFLLVADLFAEICITIENNSHSVGAINFDNQIVMNALAPYDSYVRHCWWDVAVAKGKNKGSDLSKTLRALVRESWSLLAVALDLSGRGLIDVLSEEYMAR